MFQLTSERLILIPLNLNKLQLLSQDYTLLEQSLNLEPFGVEINGAEFLEEFNQAIPNYTIPKVAENEAHFQWFTLWFVVHRAHNRGVGSIGITGLPNEQGEVMIGYFTDQRYENQGIMTESVQLLTDWIFQHPNAKSVIADTLVDGIGSQKVLQKNGFVQDGTTEEGLRWRKNK